MFKEDLMGFNKMHTVHIHGSFQARNLILSSFSCCINLGTEIVLWNPLFWAAYVISHCTNWDFLKRETHHFFRENMGADAFMGRFLSSLLIILFLGLYVLKSAVVNYYPSASQTEVKQLTKVQVCCRQEEQKENIASADDLPVSGGWVGLIPLFKSVFMWLIIPCLVFKVSPYVNFSIDFPAILLQNSHTNPVSCMFFSSSRLNLLP